VKNSAIRFLGELVIRVDDLQRMREFYENVVGLEVFADESPEYVFFRVADGVEGHPQLLAMFDRPKPEFDAVHKVLDHFAFVIDVGDYPGELRRLESHGITPRTRTLPTFRWRAMFFLDPEGNTIEFVCYDPTATE
jgi:catechol-2,3-dioxygenase